MTTTLKLLDANQQLGLPRRWYYAGEYGTMCGHGEYRDMYWYTTKTANVDLQNKKGWVVGGIFVKIMPNGIFATRSSLFSLMYLFIEGSHVDSGLRLMWAGLTRCNNPEIHAIVYDEIKDEIKRYNTKDFRKLLRDHYTALHYDWDVSAGIL